MKLVLHQFRVKWTVSDPNGSYKGKPLGYRPITIQPIGLLVGTTTEALPVAEYICELHNIGLK